MSLTHKILFSIVPRYLEKYFQVVRETHTHATRGRETDIVPCRFKTGAGKNSFRYSAATEWNSLPGHIKIIGSHSQFKREVKNWLLSRETN